jgi:hypothetical protein
VPAFITIDSGYQPGALVDSMLSDLAVGGAPDPATATPVRVMVGERTLTVDGGPPRLSNVGESGRAVPLIEGGNVMEGIPWV